MTRHFFSLTLALILGLSSPLAAQDAAPADGAETGETATDQATDSVDTGTGDATETGTGTDEAPAPGTTEPASDLSMGEPADGGEPRAGQPYIRQEFGDWALRCIRAEEGQPDPCQLYQLLMDEDDNAVAEISVFPLPEGGQAAAGATIVAPLETLLTEQIVLSVDGSAARRYPFTFCNRAGCVARVGFTQEEVNQFKRGNSARIVMVPAAAPDQTVELTVSLNGFTNGYNSAGE